ncbi:BamA/TamA family outer membrane protein [Ochrovirga pacifica]|uniref:BamA/TamA family outer membrane protein n=1 Tax=Ochrovirga pacifica TaxID=1042376 RepID=UPI0002557FA0|nr:BamA/TamA family outer membrane protein [Ochrovirga pacifica]
MNNILNKLFVLLFFLLFSVIVKAQEKKRITDEDFKKFKEFFTLYPNAKAAEKDSTLYKSKLIMAPIIGYSPETNFSLGVGSKYLFKFRGSGEETRTSNMPITIQYTLNNQFILYSGFEIFTNQEEWVITGNFAFKNFPRLFYGFGRNSLEENEEEYGYYQFRFEPIVLKQLFARHLFVGGGLRYNHIFNVKAEEEGLLTASKFAGFNGSTSAGAEFAVLYDSRDNILNAISGWYVELTHGFYGKVMGGTQEFQLSRFDVRYFFKPFHNKTDVIGIQAAGRFTYHDVPFSELALFGNEENLRGYIEGRYVDKHILATQIEYRKNLFNRVGMVAFAGVGDVTQEVKDFKFKNLRPTFGVGLRFLLDREERLNARLDWGFGENTNNLYLNIAESF